MDLLPSTAEFIVRLILAPIMGGIIGVEREWHRKPAGLRTHMMVSLGSATFTLLALDMYARVAASGSVSANVDPIRIMEGVIAGLGFIGAGSIVRAGGSVQGLTTAGGLWVAGAVGLAVGGGLYVIAGVAVALSILILSGVDLLTRRFGGSD